MDKIVNNFIIFKISLLWNYIIVYQDNNWNNAELELFRGPELSRILHIFIHWYIALVTGYCLSKLEKYFFNGYSKINYRILGILPFMYYSKSWVSKILLYIRGYPLIRSWIITFFYDIVTILENYTHENVIENMIID